jgi:hypothetical protein
MNKISVDLERYNKKILQKNYHVTQDLVKQVIAQYGSVYQTNHINDEAIGIEVTLVEKVVFRKDKQLAINTPSVSLVSLHYLAKLIINGLENIAYANQRQVAELSVNKVYGAYSNLSVEVYKL